MSRKREQELKKVSTQGNLPLARSANPTRLGYVICWSRTGDPPERLATTYTPEKDGRIPALYFLTPKMTWSANLDRACSYSDPLIAENLIRRMSETTHMAAVPLYLEGDPK